MNIDSTLKSSNAKERIVELVVGMSHVGQFRKEGESIKYKCGCHKYYPFSICEHDIEAARLNPHILRTWTPIKLQNFAGIVADEVLFSQLRGNLSPEQNEILDVYETLMCKAYIDDPSSLERPAELEGLYKNIGKAFELESSEMLAEKRLANEYAERVLREIKKKDREEAEKYREIRELLSGLNLVALFEVHCLTCFLHCRSKRVRHGLPFWQQVETYLLAPIGFFCWLELQWMKRTSNK